MKKLKKFIGGDVLSAGIMPAAILILAVRVPDLLVAFPERISEMTGEIVHTATFLIGFLVMFFVLRSQREARHDKMMDREERKKMEETRISERREDRQLREQERFEDRQLRKQEMSENTAMWASLLEKLDEQGRRSDERLEKAILLATGARKRKTRRSTANPKKPE